MKVGGSDGKDRTVTSPYFSGINANPLLGFIGAPGIDTHKVRLTARARYL